MQFFQDILYDYIGSDESWYIIYHIPHNCTSSQQNVLQDWFDVDDGIGNAAKFFVNISENVKLEKLTKAPAYVVQLCEGCNNKNSEEKTCKQYICDTTSCTFNKYLD